MRLEPLVCQILQISNQTFQTDVPKQILEQLLKTNTQLSEIELKRINTDEWTRVDQFRSDWAVLNFSQRCRLIKEYLFPPSEFILKQNDSTNKILLPYYYLKRIVLGSTKIIINQNRR